MARRVEQEESYWPGFVDALSTIVMVVTFLLIILGVAIFAISTQVTHLLNEGTAQTAKAQANLAQQQQVVAELASQQQQVRTDLQNETAARVAAEAATAATTAQLEAVVSSKTQSQQAAQDQSARLADQLDKAETQTTRIVEKLQQTAGALAAERAKVEATETALESTRQQLDKKSEQVARLSRSVATLKEAAAPKVTQDTAVDAENVVRITSTVVAVDPTEILVPAVQQGEKARRVDVTSAQEVLTVRFQDSAIDLTAEATALAKTFVDANGDALRQRPISLWSFYDGASLSVTQAKRSAYFRLLAVRTILLAGGIDPASIELSVRTAEAQTEVDTVKAFLK